MKRFSAWGGFPESLGGDAGRIPRHVPIHSPKTGSGMILGEGGAILVLEPLERAQARGVPIYAEVVGFGMSSDASHITPSHRRTAQLGR